MKTLYLVRHAKSSWDDPLLKDFDRPLNSRGKKDAPEMAKRLLDRNAPIDFFVSSPAKRARKTAAAFAEIFQAKEKDIIFKPELYLADVESFFKVVESGDDKKDHMALFSHNPGITEFANRLGVATVDDMPTCAVFAISIDTDHWNTFRTADKSFLFFDYPKKGS